MKKLLFIIFSLLFVSTISLTAQEEDEIFTVVEQMPMFPGCEDVEDKMKAKDCAFNKMLQYLYKDLKYPYEARNKGVEGTAVIQFVVNKQGRIEDAKIIRDPGEGLGKAALTSINSMNALADPWHPGKQGGKVVKVQYTLPVKFKL